MGGLTMTDKEWKEIKQLIKDNFYYSSIFQDYNDEDTFTNEEVDVVYLGFLGFHKNGDITCDLKYTIIAENRTPQQIEAIIENLL
jgi:hypothetical protein